jgi:hypothetical protein
MTAVRDLNVTVPTQKYVCSIEGLAIQINDRIDRDSRGMVGAVYRTQCDHRTCKEVGTARAAAARRLRELALPPNANVPNWHGVEFRI